MAGELERQQPSGGEPGRQQPSGGEEGGGTHVGGSTMEIADNAAVVSYNPDAPSQEWGWHGSWEQFAPRGSTLLLGLGVFGILVMVLGNHQSHTEDWWLVVIAIAMSVWMVRRARAAKRDRARRP